FRFRPEVQFNRTSVSLGNDAVGNCDVLRVPSAEPEHRPPRAESAIGYRNVAATAEQGARVVLCLHIAVGDVYVLAADEMEAVVVGVDAIVNVDSLHPHVLALDHADGMEGALQQGDVADPQVRAAIEQQMIRAVGPASPRWRWYAARGTAELHALSVDDPRT